MAVKKRATIKKTVSFSDDNTLTNRGHKKKHVDYDKPPVYVRKSLLTVPWHIPLLLYYYIYVSNGFDSLKLLFALIPLQLAYLGLQFNRCTVYGNKILKLKVPLALISLFATLLLTLPAVLIIVLFGAPITEKRKETWMLALHCCYLAYPATYQVFKGDFKVGLWKKYFIMIVVGAWSSCVVIPLDWDRDWQAWPIPVLVGAYIGSFFGYTFGSYL